MHGKRLPFRPRQGSGLPQRKPLHARSAWQVYVCQDRSERASPGSLLLWSRRASLGGVNPAQPRSRDARTGNNQTDEAHPVHLPQVLELTEISS